jgi:hypothetical protein
MAVSQWQQDAEPEDCVTSEVLDFIFVRKLRPDLQQPGLCGQKKDQPTPKQGR